MEPGPDLIGGMVRYMDGVLGLYAVCTGTEEEQVNEYVERVALNYPPLTSVECGCKVEYTAIPGTSAHY